MHLVAPLAVANHSMYETIMFIQCNRWLPSDCAHTQCALLFSSLRIQFCLLAQNMQCLGSMCFFFQFFQFTSNLSVIGLLSLCLCMACLVFHSQIDLDVFALLHFICWSIRVRFCCSFTSRFRSRQINDFSIVNNLQNEISNAYRNTVETTTSFFSHCFHRQSIEFIVALFLHAASNQSMNPRLLDAIHSIACVSVCSPHISFSSFLMRLIPFLVYSFDFMLLFYKHH